MNDALTVELLVPSSHPALAGHFPGKPVVPAVVLLDAVLARIASRGEFVLRTISASKFLQPVMPGERIQVSIRFIPLEAAQMRVSFQGARDTALVFEGSFIVSPGTRHE
jgi:3-hydroxymyristoyl/3-hydroxydecanoyl-(acyl carrier protein) dehydratase